MMPRELLFTSRERTSEVDGATAPYRRYKEMPGQRRLPSPRYRWAGLSLVGGAVLLLLVLSISTFAQAQTSGGHLKVTLTNGTTGGPGQAEAVTLFRLSSNMQPIASLDRVSGEFTLEDIEPDGHPLLLQITSGGVNYNQLLELDRRRQFQTSVTVYDVTRDWSDLEVKSARYLLRRDGNRLRVEKLYVVENRSRPRMTFYDSKGTFRFYVPPNILGSSSVYATSTSGTPTPQSFSPLPDGSGYVTWPAFKPGTTDITISYDVEFPSGTYRLHEQTFYALPQILVLVTPADIELHAEGWENLTANPESRYLVFRQSNVPPAVPLELTLASGGENSAPAAAPDGDGGAPHGRIAQLPDPSRLQKWMVIILMGAALAYGLVAPFIRRSKAPERADT